MGVGKINSGVCMGLQGEECLYSVEPVIEATKGKVAPIRRATAHYIGWVQRIRLIGEDLDLCWRALENSSGFSEVI